MQNESGHILVVDDNRLNRMTLSRGIEQHGHSVETAEDGRVALAMIREKAFDVIILDIIMPEVDGYQVLEEIKGDSALRDIPVIVVSAVDDIESIVRCIELGAEDYLTKPLNPVLLKARLDTSLDKKRHRDLERAYLQQELTLRENEKLATLGRLSAGMAHELNNPAAAARSGVRQAETAFTRLQHAYFDLFGAQLSSEQIQHLHQIDEMAQSCAGRTEMLDALARSDREQEYEELLETIGVENSWEYSSSLAHLSVEVEELISTLGIFSARQITTVIAWLSESITMYRLNHEIRHSLERVTAIVTALKSYSYMDQAPVQTVDIHDGLNDTLVMLNHRLNDRVTVQRTYAEDLPPIQGYGSELNQVWTNILNNAIDAVDGAGTITLRTCEIDRWVVVQIEDTGAGIPEENMNRVFDPFFTTKPPGQGTGLGLSISHNIIVQKHHGQINVTSAPGQTRFDIRLPRDPGV